MTYKTITDFVGRTPLVELKNYEKNTNNTILAKLEYFNPAGSVKDRIALNMIEEGIKNGSINSETTLIEPTSGNTGIGIAMVAASKGLKVKIVMPETMTVERRQLIKAYGAEIVLTKGELGMKGAILEANRLHEEIENSFILSQFTNNANPIAHYNQTGPEIYNDTLGQIDYFVAGVGTGGTISGVGKYLKEKNPNIKIIAVEPKSSPLLSTGVGGKHKIQGISAGFIPDTLDTKIYDEIILVSDEEAFEASREVAKTDGVLVGISSGAALFGAKIIASRKENVNKTIVALLPDGGVRYLSTDLFK